MSYKVFSLLQGAPKFSLFKESKADPAADPADQPDVKPAEAAPPPKS